MEINIRRERETDYKLTEAVVEKAFKGAEYSDQREHLLVARLRKSNAFLPELSLIAELAGEIVGHILLTKLIIEHKGEKHESLALAPVSVLPHYQNQGIGSKLIFASLKVAKELGFKSVVVLGHAKYYPRFGFKPASRWGIKAPFEVPDESFMALELENGSLAGVKGMVIYPEEFNE